MASQSIYEEISDTKLLAHSRSQFGANYQWFNSLLSAELSTSSDTLASKIKNKTEPDIRFLTDRQLTCLLASPKLLSTFLHKLHSHNQTMLHEILIQRLAMHREDNRLLPLWMEHQTNFKLMFPMAHRWLSEHPSTTCATPLQAIIQDRENLINFLKFIPQHERLAQVAWLLQHYAPLHIATMDTTWVNDLLMHCPQEQRLNLVIPRSWRISCANFWGVCLTTYPVLLTVLETLTEPDRMRLARWMQALKMPLVQAVPKNYADLLHFLQLFQEQDWKDLLHYELLNETQQRFSNTHLMQAIINQQPDLVQQLLAQGASVNARNLFGSTAAMFAAQQGNKRMLIQLVSHGADLSLINFSGHNVFSYAAQAQDIAVLQWLLKKQQYLPSARDAWFILYYACKNQSDAMIHFIFQQCLPKIMDKAAIAAHQLNPWCNQTTIGSIKAWLNLTNLLQLAITPTLLEQDLIQMLNTQNRIPAIASYLLASLTQQATNSSIQKLSCQTHDDRDADNLALFCRTNFSLKALTIVASLAPGASFIALINNDKCYLKSLNLYQCTIDPIAATTLAEFLQISRTIKKITLVDCQLAGQSLSLIIDAVYNSLENLQRLTLEDCNKFNKDISAITTTQTQPSYQHKFTWSNDNIRQSFFQITRIASSRIDQPNVGWASGPTKF